ncbi:MAG: hypothetical protein IIV99_02865 [Oscillospiraceae bacterium]|nr:hypothetical protein [Oscillospiraceae bacterium]
MTADSIIHIIKVANRRTPYDIDHFSIRQIGKRFYLYAHPFENDLNKKKIGTYPDYETAKKAVDTILDLKLDSIV